MVTDGPASVKCLRCYRFFEAGDPRPTASPEVVRFSCPKDGRESLGLVVKAPVDLVAPATTAPAGHRDDRVELAYREWLRTDDGKAMARLVRDLAFEIRSRGFARYGIAALFEVARWKRDLEIGPDAAGFRANNNHRSRLARDLMGKYPQELGGFFETRELHARKEEGDG